MMLNRTLQAACAVALFAGAAGPVLAQESVGSVRDFASAAPGDSPLSSPSGFEITASEGDSKASIALARQSSSFSGGVGVFNVTGLKFTTPIDADGGGATFVSRQGIPGATTVTFNFTQTRASGRGLAANRGRPGEICQAALFEEQRREQAAELSPTCDSEKVSRYAPGSLAEFQARTWEPTGLVTIWGVRGEAGYHDFDFIDGTTLKAGSERRTVWAVRGFIAWHPVDSNGFLTASAEYAEDYEAQEEQTLCANTGAPVLTCVTAPVGAPGRVQRSLLGLEYRRRFARLAASISVKQDLKNDVTTIDVPVYMIRDSDDGLTGGVRFGWSSDQDEFGASVFVSKAFSLFGN